MGQLAPHRRFFLRVSEFNLQGFADCGRWKLPVVDTIIAAECVHAFG